MLVDTHCHINMLLKKDFDVLLSKEEYTNAKEVVTEAVNSGVTKIINVGTSLPESLNCIGLAKMYSEIFATIGLHPNDADENWKNVISEFKKLLQSKSENKIVGIGECGMDFHYPDYNINRQKDVFRAQIELALENDLGISIHTRSAPDETLEVIEEYSKNNLRGVIHCFSEDLSFAKQTIEWGFTIGIGGTITYPKNNHLREVVQTINLKNILLETDAPFLPIQQMRGKKNHPKYIKDIAQYVAELKNITFKTVANQTTENVKRIFNI